MKKLTALLVAATMLFTFAGCKKDEEKDTSPPKVTTAEINADDCAMLVNNMTVSKEQFSYYYAMAYNYYAQMEAAYQAQGYSLGFDATKAPDEVNSGQTDENGNALTWNDVITEYAKSSAKSNFAFYAEATSAGYTLSAEDEETIETTLATIDSDAESMNLSTDEYLDTYIAKGLDRDDLEKLLEIEAVAKSYEETFREKIFGNITDEQVEEKYNENPAKYNYVDIYYSVLTLPSTEQAAGESDREYEERYNEAAAPVIEAANEIADAATSISAFEEAAENNENAGTVRSATASYENTKVSFSQETADWIFDPVRAAGDVKIFETDRALYVIYIDKTAYADVYNDVRHCLVKFDSDDPSDEEKMEKNEIARELLAELEEKGVTEENFIEMAKEHSDDTGSAVNGGLIEKVSKSSNYVENFEKWATAPERRAGDCQIIETEYGYHIMYYVADKGEVWKETVREELQSEAYERETEALLGEDGKYQITINEDIINEATKEFCDEMRNNSVNYAY